MGKQPETAKLMIFICLMIILLVIVVLKKL